MGNGNTAYKTREAVLRRAQEAVGIPLKEIDRTGRLSTGKGAVGTVIEESWYGYSPNSEAEPDFPEAGVELKVTPYLHGKKGIRAKERLVCNIINYMEEYDKTFDTSSFWHKCHTLLLMSYEYRKGIPKGDYKIDAAILFQFPEEDLEIIRQDWEKIMEKVRAGRAHEISEGDTLYLSACPKGVNASSMRQQPFSDIPAKQRAYSLKTSYMTRVLNRYLFGAEESPSVIRDWRLLRKCRFEEYIVKKVSPFYGMTQKELKLHFQVNSKAKNLNEILLARMLEVTGRIAYTEEFQKAGIIPRTVRVQKNGKVKESMPFPAFDFIELSREECWEDSELYIYLAPAKFLFAIFQQREDGAYVFDRVMFWNIPSQDLEEVRKVWERAVRTVREGVVMTPMSRGIRNNLPKQSESPVAHVRPHGHGVEDTLPLPDGRRMEKHCFWLNSTYIRKQISETF